MPSPQIHETTTKRRQEETNNLAAAPRNFELPLAALGFIFFIAASLYIASSVLGLPIHYPWTKPFWLDEFHTWLLVEQDSIASFFINLSQRVDTNPPTLHLILRVWALAFGSSPEFCFRHFSSLCALAALVGMYWLLRQAGSSIAVAFLVPMLVWTASPLLPEQAFDGRFYAPWLAACVWLCIGMNSVDRSPRSSPAIILASVCSILVCTIHYFGIITLALIALFHLMARRRTSLQWLRHTLILTPGPIALACCLPLYLQQRSVMGGLTWVPEASLSSVAMFSGYIYALTPTTGLAFLLAAEILLRHRSNIGSGTPSLPDPCALAGPLALFLFPLCLIVFSIIVQPAMVPRYALPYLAGVAPIFAVLLIPLRGWLLSLVYFAVLLTGWVNSVPAFLAHQDGNTAPFMQHIAASIGPGVPIIFPNRHTAYVAWRYGGVERGQVKILIKPSADIPESLAHYESIVTVQMTKLYPGLPELVDDEFIRRQPHVLLIDFRPPETVRNLYESYYIRPLAQEGAFTLYRIEAKSRGSEKGINYRN